MYEQQTFETKQQTRARKAAHRAHKAADRRRKNEHRTLKWLEARRRAAALFVESRRGRAVLIAVCAVSGAVLGWTMGDDNGFLMLIGAMIGSACGAFIDAEKKAPQ